MSDMVTAENILLDSLYEQSTSSEDHHGSLAQAIAQAFRANDVETLFAALVGRPFEDVFGNN